MHDKRFLSPREFIETERANWAKWSMCDVSYENCTCVFSCHRRSHTGRDLRPPPIIVMKSLTTGIVKTDPKIGKALGPKQMALGPAGRALGDPVGPIGTSMGPSAPMGPIVDPMAPIGGPMGPMGAAMGPLWGHRDRYVVHRGPYGRPHMS